MTARRYGWYALLLLGGFVVVTLWLVFRNPPGQSPTLRAEELIFSDVEPPLTWSTDRGGVTVEGWILRSTDRVRAPDGVIDKAAVHWRSVGDGSFGIPDITERILVFENTRVAEAEFAPHRLELTTDDLRRASNEQKYPSGWTGLSMVANEEHLACGVGVPEACQEWFYWARYGPYWLNIELFAPNRAMSWIDFTAIVADIERGVAATIASSGILNSSILIPEEARGCC